MQLFVSRPGGGLQAVNTSPNAVVLDAVLEALDWPSTSARCDVVSYGSLSKLFRAFASHIRNSDAIRY